MARLLAAVCACVVLTVATSVAEAQVEVPRGRVGLLGQLQQNTGEAGDAYRFAWMVGVDASYEVARLSKFNLAAAWSLAGGLFNGAADELADDEIRVLEMSLGLRLRRSLGRTTPRFFVAGAGATILRLDRAVPPDNERLYLGPYASIGLDQYLSNKLMVSFAVRYGLIVNGPASLAVRIGISLGS